MRGAAGRHSRRLYITALTEYAMRGGPVMGHGGQGRRARQAREGGKGVARPGLAPSWPAAGPQLLNLLPEGVTTF